MQILVVSYAFVAGLYTFGPYELTSYCAWIGCEMVQMLPQATSPAKSFVISPKAPLKVQNAAPMDKSK